MGIKEMKFNPESLKKLMETDLNSIEDKKMLLVMATNIQNALKQETLKAVTIGKLFQKLLKQTGAAASSIEGTIELLKEFIGNLFPKDPNAKS